MDNPGTSPDLLPAGISLGSNIGDRLNYLCAARERLRDLHEGIDSEFLVSPVYETEPVGCAPGTESFLNAVIQMQSSREPEELLDLLQTIEGSLGRPGQRPKNAPRTIDLDLLFTDAGSFHHPRLTLPHPRLHRRRFVLQPLADIAGGVAIPPDNTTANELLVSLDSGEPALSMITRHW